MELKFVDRDIRFLTIIRSNRTFMELKCKAESVTWTVEDVLIAPLWN